MHDSTAELTVIDDLVIFSAKFTLRAQAEAASLGDTVGVRDDRLEVDVQEEVDGCLEDHSCPCPSWSDLKEELLGVGLEYLREHNFEGESRHPEKILHPVVGLQGRDWRDYAQKGHTSRQKQKEGCADSSKLGIREEILHDE